MQKVRRVRLPDGREAVELETSTEEGLFYFEYFVAGVDISVSAHATGYDKFKIDSNGQIVEREMIEEISIRTLAKALSNKVF